MRRPLKAQIHKTALQCSVVLCFFLPMGCRQQNPEEIARNSIQAMSVEINRDAMNVSRSGSGLLLSEDTIVTCLHVVDGNQPAWIQTPTGAIPAIIVAKDSVDDLAKLRTLLPLEAPDLHLRFRAPSLADPGTTVFVSGSPYGLERSLLRGYVSSLHGEPGARSSSFQVQGIAHPGVSGAPIVALDGSIIGMVRATYSIAPYSGLGFAISGATVERFSRGN